MSKLSDLAVRLDGWFNSLTGLGGSRDKATGSYFTGRSAFSNTYLEQTYLGDDLAARIVDALPEAALSHGWRLQTSDPDDAADRAKALNDLLAELGARDTVLRALCAGRAYGGAIVLIGLRDGLLVSDAVVVERIGDVEFLNALDCRDVSIASWYQDPLAPNYGEPATYSLTSTGKIVHASRAIRCPGVPTSVRDRIATGGWDHSVLHRVHDVLQQTAQQWQAAAHMLQDSSQGVLKIKGLFDALQRGDQTTIQTRAELLDMSRSVARCVLLDADESEEFGYVARSLASVPELLDRGMQRLAAAARMPVALLMGRSPAGLNATGDADLTAWYDSVDTYRTHSVAPILQQIVRLCAYSLGDPAPESWSIEWPRLWQESPLEAAQRRQVVAQADASYVSAGIYAPEEVAIARNGGLDAPVVVDAEARQRMLDLDMSEAWKQE